MTLSIPDQAVLDSLTDFDSVKEKIGCRLINAERNADALSDRPYTLVDDLAVTYHIDLGKSESGQMSTPVTNRLLEMYGVDTEQLHGIALGNMPHLSPPRFKGMSETMAELLLPDAMANGMSREEAEESAASYRGLLNEMEEKTAEAKRLYVELNAFRESAERGELTKQQRALALHQSKTAARYAEETLDSYASAVQSAEGMLSAMRVERIRQLEAEEVRQWMEEQSFVHVLMQAQAEINRLRAEQEEQRRLEEEQEEQRRIEEEREREEQECWAWEWTCEREQLLRAEYEAELAALQAQSQQSEYRP